MYGDRSLNFTVKERDLQLFLEALGVKLPPCDPALPDDYIIIQLDPDVAALFEASDNKAVLLAYRIKGRVFPLSLLFLRQNEKTHFCHSTFLLDSYTHGDEILPQLSKAVQELFACDCDCLLATLEPSWASASLDGQLDCRVIWNAKPDMKVVTDLLEERLGEVCVIPSFPTVYHYNNPYNENLLEVALPELAGCRDVLVLGTGAGLDAACVALKYGIQVDATDINPIAIANTMATCRRTGTEHQVNAWVGDGLKAVRKNYDAILFEAPLATNETRVKDLNRYDIGGRLLKEVLSALPSHLKPGGRMYLMSCPDISPYVSGNELQREVLRDFEAKSTVAIHKLWRR